MTTSVKTSTTDVGCGGVDDVHQTQTSRQHQLKYVQQNVASNNAQLVALMTEKREEQVDIIVVQDPSV